METSWKEELNELIEVLGLEHKPVAVTFTNDLVELGERKPVWICRALKLAAQGESLVIEKENCTCPGGSWHSGLGERPPRERWRGVQRFLTQGEKLSHSIVTFHRMLELSTPPPTGLCERILMGPVHEAEFRPDLVVFMCNPEQACRLITLDQYWDGIPPRTELAGSLCHSALAYTVTTGQTNVTLGDWTARRMQKFPEDMIFISVPYERIHNLVTAVPQCTAGSAELEIPEEFRHQFEEE